MTGAFNKDTLRAIGHSLGRFLAIAGIVALGCGFYAGLRMTGPDMRINADTFYDGTHLYDLRVLSSLGFSDEGEAQIAAVPGVQATMASKSTDVMIDSKGEQLTARVSSMDMDAARTSYTSDGIHAISEDDAYLNRPILAQGSWPTAADECVVSADRVTNNPIQVGDVIEVEYGTQDLDEVLQVRRFTVTGLAHSSLYVSASAMGTTNLGSGVLEQFLFVSPDAFSEDFPATEVYVAVEGASALFSGSFDYQSSVDDVAKELQGIEGSLAQTRQDQLRQSAQATLDEKKAEYETQRDDAQTQLADARAKLDDAAASLEQGRRDVASGQAQYDSGVVQLAQQRASFEQMIADTDAQLIEGQQQVDAGQAALDAAEAQLQPQWDQYTQSAAQLSAGWDSYNTQRAAWSAAVAALDPTDPQYAVKKAALDSAGAQLDAVQAQLAFQHQQLDAGKAQLDDAQARFDAQAAQVAQARADIEAGRGQLEAGRISGQQQIDAAQAQLNAAAAQLESGRAQVASGQQEYEDGLAEYTRQETEATEKLDDAKRQLDEAQQKIDDIESPQIYVLDRTKNHGAESFKADAGRVDNIAAVFPFIFFLVAALVALTTMTRMVDEDRILIGTYKALGYSRARITGKYLFYAATASIVGAVVGIAVLSQVLPWVICLAYAIIYNVPQPPLPLAVDVPIALLSAGMGVGLTLLATWAAAAATLREQPAALMLPRAPKAGKRILLEHVGPLWRRLSFSWKVTCRNLFRYKKRFAMTVIGIGGCTALLLTGLGLSNAINDIIDKQFGGVLQYNTIITLKDDAGQAGLDEVERVLAESGHETSMATARSQNHFVNSASDENQMSVVLVSPRSAQDFANLMEMKNRVTGEKIFFDDDSVVITEKLATALGVKPGDTVNLFDQDDIGNATGQGMPITVTAVMENYVGNYLYVGCNAYAQALGKPLECKSVFANMDSTSDERAQMVEVLRATDSVDTVAFNDETIDSYRKMLTSVDMIVVVLVVAAAALAFIVLYNLTNINITERRREIASLKVLGFTAREVDLYIFREIALLTLVGAALGLVLGIGMESFVVISAEVDQVMFGREIHALSFVWAYLITIGFAVVVMLAMRRKLDTVDMVESLKSMAD